MYVCVCVCMCVCVCSVRLSCHCQVHALHAVVMYLLPNARCIVLCRNEVQRWNTRTNQLIEQYNKIDPEEYKKLL